MGIVSAPPAATFFTVSFIFVESWSFTTIAATLNASHILKHAPRFLGSETSSSTRRI